MSGISWGSHDFSIRGFSLAKGMGVGKYIESDTFTVGGYDWVIMFYPDGIYLEADRFVYVSVLIALASKSASDVRTMFELTLLDQSGKGQHRVHGHLLTTTPPCTLKCQGSTMGYKRLLRRESLETSDYLKDDCLSMHCKVGVVREGFTFSIPPYDITRNLRHLLETETGCDNLLCVGDQTFKAHKSILAARSPLFRAQFFGKNANIMGDQVELKDVEPSIFKVMLLFIYSDTLPDSMPTDIITQLLAAADRFGVDWLKRLCEAKLQEQVNVDTVETTLSFADKHHCLQLKFMCLEFAIQNSEGLMKKKGLKYLRDACNVLFSEIQERKDHGEVQLLPLI